MEIDIAGVLERNKDRLAQQIEAITRDQIEAALHNEAEQVIAQAVEEFLQKEVKPEIKKKLTTMKAQIIAGMAEYLEKIGAELAKRLYQSAIKNLGESYNLGQIIERLFR